MTDQELRGIVQDLLGVLHDQAKQIESLVVHVERATGRVPEQQQFSVITSEISELQHRMKVLIPAPKS